ncbi:MAG TPA: hypothetical protein VNL35_10870 [Chloroflexota bacterium]|nr:hypothetical protein [Chloroflexota bacterium]
MMLDGRSLVLSQGSLARSRALKRAAWQRLVAVGDHPAISVGLSVLGFAFLGPIAALVVVATMLDHEFAHRVMMRRLGYQPGPVRMIPLVGAFVKARRPMVRSSDIALIYLAGPLAGVLSAVVAALVASHALPPPEQHAVYVGALVSVALNLFNLIPLEPLDGGLISRVLPYPCLLLFPGLIAVGLLVEGRLATPIGVAAVGGAVWLTWRKIGKWRRYLWLLRARERWGDLGAVRELVASLQVPLAERVLVVFAYLTLVTGCFALLAPLAQAAHWMP